VTFPARVQFTASTQTSLTAAANTYTFSACTATNLIVICLAGDKNTGTLSVSDNISGSTGWVVETSIPGASVSLYVAYKVAVGGETTVTATTSTASIVGNSGYGEELSDDGSGTWTVVAKATPTYDNTVRTSAASGTTDTADYDGRALAVGVIDSLSSLASDTSQDNAPTFSNSFTRLNTPARPSGSGGGNAGCYVASLNLAAAATTSTTFTLNAGAGDQLTCAIVAFGRVETAGTTGELSATLPLPTASLAADVNTASLAATVPVPTASLAATVTASGALAASVPMPTAALTAAVDTPGTLLRAPRLGIDKIALRISGGSGPVRIDFSLASDMSSPISSTTVTPSGLGDAHVPIPAELTPATLYYFRPYQGGYFGTVRSFTTLPGTSQTSFKFAFSSCRQHGEDAPVLGDAISRGAQLFVHLGDAHYEDINSTNAALYRSADDEQYTPTNLAAALTTIPGTYTWSDHDFCGDSSTASATGKATVRQVYRERVPSPTLPSATGGIYHTFAAWGGRLRFIVLDTRSYRDSIGTTADGTMLGSEQLTWLQTLLAAVEEPLTFICSAEGWQSAGSDDDWGFYQNERTTIAGWITAADTEVVFLCGDMHKMAIATPANSTPGGVRVWHGAAMNQFDNGTKGGPYASLASYHSAGVCGLVELTQSSTQISATFVGLRSGTTDWSGTDTVTVDTGTTGALAASLPVPTAQIAATVTADAALSTSLPAPIAALDGGVTAAGALDTALPMPTAALEGAVSSAGVLAAELPSPTAALDGTVTTDGALAATLPLPIATLGSLTVADGVLAAELPMPTAALSAESAEPGALSAVLPLPVAELVTTVTATGELTAVLPLPVATLLEGASPTPPVRAGEPVAIPGPMAATPTVLISTAAGPPEVR